LVRRVADELAAAGWKLKAVGTDNGGQFRAEPFARSVAGVGAKNRHSRRPTADQWCRRAGAVHHPRKVLGASFARQVPRYTALRRDLNYYNFERAHTGRRNAGRPPAKLVYGARNMRPR
jgi:hypothetical protein